MTRAGARVYLVDASIYIFRAYYSVPDTLTNADGQLINALHGFAGFLGSFLDEAKPAHLAVVFDQSLTTSFRNEIYPSSSLPGVARWCSHWVSPTLQANTTRPTT